MILMIFEVRCQYPCNQTHIHVILVSTSLPFSHPGIPFVTIFTLCLAKRLNGTYHNTWEGPECISQSLGGQDPNLELSKFRTYVRTYPKINVCITSYEMTLDDNQSLSDERAVTRYSHGLRIYAYDNKTTILLLIFENYI